MEEATGAPSSLAVSDPKRLRASGRDGETVMTEPPSPLRMLLSRHTSAVSHHAPRRRGCSLNRPRGRQAEANHMSRSWRDHFAVPIEGAADCPKCGRPMQRCRHSASWRPLPGRGFFPLVGRVRRLRAHPILRTGARRAGRIARHLGADANDSDLRREIIAADLRVQAVGDDLWRASPRLQGSVH
jgi:hypothetical protein